MKKPKTETAPCDLWLRSQIRSVGCPSFRPRIFPQRHCPNCNEASNQEALATQNQERRGALEEAWLRLCPPRYRRCDRALLPIAAETIDRLLGWRPLEDGRGLGLVGPPHIGKRRSLYLLAEHLHFAGGIRVAQISDLEFVRLGSEDEEIRACSPRDRRARSAPVLIFSILAARD
jgi:hypothetical protein